MQHHDRTKCSPNREHADTTRQPSRHTERPAGRLELLAELVAAARRLPPMTPEQREDQAVFFAYGNLALMRAYRNASPEKLAELLAMCRAAARPGNAHRKRREWQR